METILVVDDEPMIRSMMDSALSAIGYTVVVAGSVREAIDLLEGGAFRFGAIVTDYNLGDGSGRDIVNSVRASGLKAPTIVISGSLRIDRDESIRQGFSAYFQKPFSCLELGRKLNALLNKRSASTSVWL